MKVVFAFLFFLLVKIDASAAELMKDDKAKPAEPVILSAQDSSFSSIINLHDLVKAQFESAQTSLIKSSFNWQPVRKFKAEKNKKNEEAENEIPLSLTKSEYLNSGIILILSVLIAFLFLRKKIINFLKLHSLGGLKKSISLLRNEQPITIHNKKLRQVRESLSDSPEIIRMKETGISGKAKNLKLGKGELMLAAKIKSYHLSSLSKQESL